jgi:hypothetical protein
MGGREEEGSACVSGREQRCVKGDGCFEFGDVDNYYEGC